MKRLLVLIAVLLSIKADLPAQDVIPELESKYNQLEYSKSLSDPDLEDIRVIARELFGYTKSPEGVNMDLIADQITSTNAVRNFWDYAREPREEIANTEETFNTVSTRLFDSFIKVQLETSVLIYAIENDGKIFTENSIDITEVIKTNLFFLRGLAKSYLGLIYDRGFIVNDGTIDPETEIKEITLPLSSYSDVISSGISDIETAISMIESLEENTDGWILLDSFFSITNDDFLKIAHSIIAKILINSPRSSFEEIDYQKVLYHANHGLDSNYKNILFKNIGDDGEFADHYSNWLNFVVSGNINTGAGYLPADVKVMHLLEDTYPTSYPEEEVIDGNPSFREVNSSDPRVDYYKYTLKPGFLRESRGKNLFSNYFPKRTHAGNDWRSANYPFIFMTQAEIQYIKAEAHFMLDSLADANTALQNSPYGTIPTDFVINLPAVQLGYTNKDGLAFQGPQITDDQVEFIKLLHKEYSVEVSSLSSVGTVWFFMRRHDLLQKYSPLHYPVPFYVLEEKSEQVYSFGGVKNINSSGTATGANAWKETTRMPRPFGFKASPKNEAIEFFWDAFPIDISGFIIENNVLGLSDTLSSDKTSYTLSEVENDVDYAFSLKAYKDDLVSDAISLETRASIFGVDRNDYFRVFFDSEPMETNTKIITLNNSLDIPVNIDSVKVMSPWEAEDHPNNKAYQDYHEDWKTFFSFEDNPSVVPANSSVEFKIDFTPNLFGFYPEMELYIYTSDGLTKLNFSSVTAFYNDPKEPYTRWALYLGVPDSINFGTIPVGEVDSVMFTIYNNSTLPGIIDDFYTLKSPLGSNIDDTDSVFSFGEFPDTVRIETYESLDVWLYVKPVSDQPYEAYAFWSGDNEIHGGSIGYFTVNKGERDLGVTNEEEYSSPDEFWLSDNYPNPFNPSTNIKFNLPYFSSVNLVVYNLLGQRVATLVDDNLASGSHTVQFNASNLSSGIYFYRLEAGNFISIKKMMLIK